MSNEHNTTEQVESRRRWCFTMALQMKQELDIAADVIYRAAEIETYIVGGNNPRADFISSVDAALSEVEHAQIDGVGEDKKRKVLEKLRHWLKEYDVQ